MGTARRFAGLLAVGSVVALGACAKNTYSAQAHLCRLAAVALADPVPVRTGRETPLPDVTAGAKGIRIDLAPQGEGPHFIECRFGPSSQSEPDLVGVTTDRGALPEANLFALKRFWLEAPESADEDPAAAVEAERLPPVPTGLGYALQQFLAALPSASIYSLLAAAYSLVYGLTGRINLAFGEIAAVGGFAALFGVVIAGGAPAALLVAAGLAYGVWASGIHGVAIQRLVVWPLRGVTGQQGLVATIGLALFLDEYLRLANGNQPKWISSILSDPVPLVRAPGFTVTVTPITLILSAAAVAASIGVLLLLHRSDFGREWRASADDPLAASLFGVDPARLAARTFALSCGLAGLAGATSTLFYGTVGYVYTTTLGLKALIAAILGGIGSVPGAFLGGLLIALLEAGWSAYFPIVYRDLVVFCLLVAMLVVRPGGLFGYRDLLPRRV